MRTVNITIGVDSGTQSLTAVVDDTVSMTDTRTFVRQHGRTQVDNLAVTDVVGRVVSNVESRADNLGLTDSVSAVKTGLPSAPLTLTVSNVQNTSVRLTWTQTADATVTKHGIYQGNTLLVDNISPAVLQYDWGGLLPNTLYSNINVRRFNSSGWSTGSPSVSFTTASSSGLSPLFTGHVPGKVYLGWSTSETDSVAENQLNTQTPLPAGSVNYTNLLGVRRIYNKNATDISRADTNGRIVWISLKASEIGGSGTAATAWAQIANGSLDTQIVNYFASLVARNKVTFFTYHHEPVGDGNQTNDPLNFIAANQRIMLLVDTNYPGHRIIFCQNYIEHHLRSPGGVDFADWFPEHMCPGRGGTRPWDLITWDMYQYGGNTSATANAGVQFSHRWWRVDGLFAGTFRPTGTSVMPWMTYTPGEDITFGLGECAARPEWFYNWENGLGGDETNMTGAKYARDKFDYIFSNREKFAIVSWFNSIGVADERLYPNAATWGGDTQPLNLVQQTGDTEYTINVYREKLNSGFTVKLASNGLPPP